MAPALVNPEELVFPTAWCAEGVTALVAGQVVEQVSTWLSKRDHPEFQMVRAAPSASALLRLSVQAWTSGAAVAAEQAMPLYLRDKVAQTTAEREALKKP
jgi:tRNA threonylcarbamoyladenosine biosynthesis protein TsaB